MLNVDDIAREAANEWIRGDNYHRKLSEHIAAAFRSIIEQLEAENEKLTAELASLKKILYEWSGAAKDELNRNAAVEAMLAEIHDLEQP